MKERQTRSERGVRTKIREYEWQVYTVLVGGEGEVGKKLKF
jgi:hypothetical protein